MGVERSTFVFNVGLHATQMNGFGVGPGAAQAILEDLKVVQVAEVFLNRRQHADVARHRCPPDGAFRFQRVAELLRSQADGVETVRHVQGTEFPETGAKRRGPLSAPMIDRQQQRPAVPDSRIICTPEIPQKRTPSNAAQHVHEVRMALPAILVESQPQAGHH